MGVDLHIHTTASDGTLEPAQVVREASRAGLTAIAITDHDTMSGVAEAMLTGREEGLDVFPGVEISCELRHTDVHILGYFVLEGDDALSAALQQVRASRLDRVDKIVRRLQALGVSIATRDVASVARGASVGRPHVAAALVACGAVATQKEAFRRYLRRGKPAYVDRHRVLPQEAIRLIHLSGGLPVLAHPGLGCSDRTVRDMVRLGVEGLEAYHVDHTAGDTSRYLRMAEELGLLVTGGSDSHGPGGPSPVRVGQVHVPDECATHLKAWAAAHGRWPMQTH